MPRTKLYMTTLSSVINFSEDDNKIFALKNGLIYFLDTKKLDNLLSIMCYLRDFNEYNNLFKERNITEWLKDRKLLTVEILKEICFGYRECPIKDEIKKVFSFSDDFFNTKLIFRNFLKKSLYNIVAFDYIKENQNKINEYIAKMLIFFKKNDILKKKPYPFQFFINCLFETEKIKMYNKIAYDFNFEFECFLDRNIFEYFEIEKIANNKEEFFFESLKTNCFIEFEVFYNTNNQFFCNIDKYLQISKYMSEQRQILEQKLFAKVVLKEEKINSSKEYFLQQNMSIMNLNQLFYTNMSEENKQTLNELLPYRIEDFVFYYKIKPEKTMEKINYLQIKKEI